MMLDVADIGDGRVRCGADTIHGPVKPVRDQPVAAARPRRKAFGKNLRWRRDRNHDDISVDPAHRIHDRARYLGDNRTSGPDNVVDRTWQRVAMAVRFPMNSELAITARLPEGLKAHLLIILEK